MIPGGKVYISVPDLDILTKLFLMKENLTLDERFFVMRMIFGGHTDENDYHLTGLNEEFLVSFLTQAGFCDIERVKKFGFFADTSTIEFKNIPISLNVIAEKPGQ